LDKIKNLTIRCSQRWELFDESEVLRFLKDMIINKGLALRYPAWLSVAR